MNAAPIGNMSLTSPQIYTAKFSQCDLFVWFKLNAWVGLIQDSIQASPANLYPSMRALAILFKTREFFYLKIYIYVLQVALASGEGPYIEKVREAQKGVTVPNVILVDAKGLPLNPDHLHLTTKAQVQLGKMLADAYSSHFSLA